PVLVGGARPATIFVTTSYGLTLAVDADTGAVLWRFTPDGYASWAGSSQITHASPLADPGRRSLYAAAPDGRIHKLDVADGTEVRDGGWPVAVTRDPTHEKIGPALNFARGLVLIATGGYIGDAPPYQGHVAAIDARSGRLVHVWNSLCSDRPALLDPPSCPETRSAIWARAGVVVDPATGNLLVADRAGTAGYVLTRGRLARQWENPTAGTSPVVAGGLLWVYDPGGTLAVYEPTSGKAIAPLPAGPGHWSSPIVTAGRVVLPV